jgi:outer membrane biosynthesis protein TonB
VAEQEPQATRVELKATDIPPPDAPPPSASAPAGGPLSLASEATGAGDAFNLVGNPGGRGILTGGGLGDGTGEGQLGGSGGPGSTYGWYYARLNSRIGDLLRRQKDLLTAAATRVDIRVWVDGDGVVTRIQPIRSSGNPKLDQALQSVVGLRCSETLPGDLPMPMVLRLTVRRPE